MKSEVGPVARHSILRLQTALRVVKVDVIDARTVEIHPLIGKHTHLKLTLSSFKVICSVGGGGVEIAGLEGDVLVGGATDLG